MRLSNTVSSSANTPSWNRAAEAYLAETRLATDVVHYGPGLPTEREVRLLGALTSIDDRAPRVLDLGCGPGHNAIVLARQGAHVIGVDSSSVQIAQARRLAEQAEVRCEWHIADSAELAFLRADSVDLVLCAAVLSEIADIDRVFRQVHRVMRAGTPFVFSHEHPLALATMRAQGEPVSPRGMIARPYGEQHPMIVERYGQPFTLYPRTLAAVFSALHRAGFEPDVLLEPPGPEHIPSGVIWRARRLGV